MIKSIKNIHYKSFDSFDASDVEFKQVNLMFGYNGQGKSSLADFIKTSIENGTLDNFTCSQENYKIFVYDEKYKRNTLYIDDDEKGNFSSFYAGENIRELILSKRKIESKITKLESYQTKYENNKNRVENEIDDLKTRIAKNTRNELYKIKPMDYKSPQSYTKSHIQNEFFETAVPLNNDKFEQILKFRADKMPEYMELFAFNSPKQVVSGINTLETILKQTPQNKAIERFKKDAVLENFAKAALEMKNKYPLEYNTKCPLCEQDITAINLWKNLEQHFNDEYEKLIERLKKAKDFFESVKNEANGFIKWLNDNLIANKVLLKEKIDIDELRNDYFNNVNSFMTNLDNIINTIQEKEKSPNKDDISLHLYSSFNEIVNKLQSNQIKEIIDWHNTQQRQYNEIIKENILKIKEHFIAIEKDEFAKLNNKVRIIYNKFKRLQECKNKRYKQIKCFDEKLKQIDESFKNLNDDLNEWFFKDIRFEKITNSHYKTQRQDCNGAYFDCKSGLSEGEKTIVSMIYFANSYLASLSNLQECPLLIIDDPVTSLDSQNKEKIVNYISNKIFSNLRGQVFILSHDKEIVKKFSKKVNNGNNVFCIEKTNLKSNIKPATSDMLFNNEIIEIYNKLKKYIEAPNENYTIIDLSRKLLEKLFVVFYGEKCENFTDCYNDLLKKFGLIAKYTASDIQELNHNKSDRDIFAELPQKVEFVLEIFEKATKRNG